MTTLPHCETLAAPPLAPPRDARPRDTLTLVELFSIDKRLEHSVRFGRIAHRRVLTPTAQVVSLRADAVFALLRRSWSDVGTVFTRLDILRAVRSGEAYTTVPFVQPGGELYLSINGEGQVARVLALIDAIEASGIDLCDVAPDHWRHVQNRLAAQEQPRPYTPVRHTAWLQRKALEP